MSQVVVISGHPDLASSNTNQVILDRLDTHSQVAVRRLDSLYGNGSIDVAAEQQALLEAEVVVLQFPFYWYSVPALLKRWIDEVFSYNFAYGAKGDKLKGKALILSTTIGGPESSYDPLGYNHFGVEELLRPLQQTAYLAGMDYQQPIYSHGMVYIEGVYNELSEVQQRAREHADRLLVKIDNLLNSDERRIEAFARQWFGQFDLLPESSEYFEAHLSEQLKLVMPEGEFSGIAGFRDWYAHARQSFIAPCEHQLEQILVKSTDTAGLYQVELRVRLIANTQSHSSFAGQALNLLVNESWLLSLSASGHISLHEYLVTPV